ncbi:uncharacterized protein BCR38DRAFT_412830 [Pseudomassariella vexata]|uniref:Uncharacterized protein n=1 Tax=Pseudomassariella vexata TaxID=1141098 RepID=A0A1Y2DJ08_9PEZI|nr:uncharacterized protein BCR38DRAFT_412830 [Pseudomassariella vexata]ORY59114.1 hypothetical protein BCR38DRAFT_412830 [Pseudomassariella vexata]
MDQQLGGLIDFSRNAKGYLVAHIDGMEFPQSGGPDAAPATRILLQDFTSTDGQYGTVRHLMTVATPGPTTESSVNSLLLRAALVATSATMYASAAAPPTSTHPSIPARPSPPPRLTKRSSATSASGDSGWDAYESIPNRNVGCTVLHCRNIVTVAHFNPMK